MSTEMKFVSCNGKEIIFDDYVNETEEYNSYWAEMCSECREKYKSILNNRESLGAAGTCSVKGCENEASYYVDFKSEEISEIDINK